jgi:hypothetical protein
LTSSFLCFWYLLLSLRTSVLIMMALPGKNN